MLEKVHGVKSLEDIGFTPDMKEKTARVAPYIRDRITFMRILILMERSILGMNYTHSPKIF